ncbi:zinc dependent phospholipase C family protein [Collinsella sp. zg1085]|uniref:zinc dependent phospholipase C family protein n=1 Tax=Collinsella sp. zg1085 TaxID=2844380 RepID=UPI001C0DC75A|nr:zinc dependent phospholipase C family protein [Collinsella sp. zg1085]QWT17577.1 zinc dependent phospholipase C family protein [Collinsella sp. zg1085]
MPALMTHHLFGEESIERLPGGLIASEEERLAFLLANQGPDPFFFHVLTLQLPLTQRLAHEMHSSYITKQFESLHRAITHLPPRDAALGRAFVLGLLSHYVLDRNAHPYVYAMQWGIQAVDEDLEHAGSQVHAVIESDLDVYMVQLKRSGATTADYPPVDELVTTERINKVAGALIAHMAREVYDLEISPRSFGDAVRDMQYIYRLIEPAQSNKSFAIQQLEGFAHRYSMLGALAHRVTSEPPARTANLNHIPWEHPFTHEESSESFPELFDRALLDYEQAAELFVEGADFVAVTRRINYSGRLLDESEICLERD